MTTCSAYVAQSEQNKALVVAFRGAHTYKQQFLAFVTEFGRKVDDRIVESWTTFQFLGLLDHKFADGLAYGYVLEGMQGLYQDLVAQIKAILTEHPDYDVWITGQSFGMLHVVYNCVTMTSYVSGGGLAYLFATQLRLDNVVAENQIKEITFGTPRAGSWNVAVTHDRLVRQAQREKQSELMLDIS